MRVYNFSTPIQHDQWSLDEIILFLYVHLMATLLSLIIEFRVIARYFSGMNYRLIAWSKKGQGNKSLKYATHIHFF